MSYNSESLLPTDEYTGHPTELLPEDLCYIRLIDANTIEFCSKTVYPGCRFKYDVTSENGAVHLLHKFHTQFLERKIPHRTVYNGIIINRTNIFSEKRIESTDDVNIEVVHVTFDSMRDGLRTDITYPPGTHVIDY
jgi:hypothetical protein